MTVQYYGKILTMQGFPEDKRGVNSDHMSVHCTYNSLREYCLLMCSIVATPGRVGVFQDRRGVLHSPSPLGETLLCVHSVCI